MNHSKFSDESRGTNHMAFSLRYPFAGAYALIKVGYKLIARDISVLFAPASPGPIPFEDWWVGPQMIGRDMIGAIQAINSTARLPRDLIFSS